jgi:NTE family protein
METSQFTDAVADVIANAKAQLAGKHFSDIVDQENNQYVDLVMGGGGVLGIALVGYTYVLEEIGIRFLRIGGTSAGSINAVGLAAVGLPQDKKSDRLIAELANVDIWSFADGSASARELVRDYVKGSSTLELGWDAARAYRAFASRLGLHPGDTFQEWLAGVLERAGITTFRELTTRLRTVPPGLRIRDKELLDEKGAGAELAVVATDIATETKAVLPRMAALYWSNPDDLNPAIFARASMSIPFFFEPLRVQNVPQGIAAEKEWERLAGYSGPVYPKECAFVDGGVLSNFPINIFHEPESVPTAPTFGVKLGSDQRVTQSFKSLLQLTQAVFNSARHSLDYDFLVHNPDYRELICCIDTGDQSWLNFDLSDDDRIDLFRRGAKAAVKFLTTFDWKAYKEIRRNLMRGHVEDSAQPNPGAGGPIGSSPISPGEAGAGS